jgi:hypothetical protein
MRRVRKKWHSGLHPIRFGIESAKHMVRTLAASMSNTLSQHTTTHAGRFSAGWPLHVHVLSSPGNTPHLEISKPQQAFAFPVTSATCAHRAAQPLHPSSLSARVLEKYPTQCGLRHLRAAHVGVLLSALQLLSTKSSRSRRFTCWSQAQPGSVGSTS